MFRPSKKRPKKTRVVTTNDENDSNPEDEGPALSPPEKKKQKKKKKDKAPVIMSFEVDDDQGDGLSKTRKKKKRGLGYGGAAAAALGDSHTDNEDKEQEESSAIESVLYGKGALEKLKAEQRFRAKSEKTTKEEVDPPLVERLTSDPPTQPSEKDSNLPDFLPLDSSISSLKAPVILTGEEAISFNDPDSDANKIDKDAVLEPPNFISSDTAQEAWETEVVRRAGVSSRNTTTASKDKSNMNVPSMTQLKQQVLSTVSQLKTQQEDLTRAHDRRLVEKTQVQSEFDREQKELESAGKSLEYYQEIREQLASWVGALRELHSKIKPLRKALLELDVETCGSSRWREREDDMVIALREAGVLDQVLGRQPNIPVVMEEEQHAAVDEFGRDIKSRAVLERETRARQRRRIQQQKQEGPDGNKDTEANTSDGELDDRLQRRNALQEALHVAKDELDTDYTSLAGLVRIFDNWFQEYPEEYKQCFASLSMADLASVLIEIDMCSQLHPLFWRDKMEIDSKQLPWLEYFQDAPISSKSNDIVDTTTRGEAETPLQYIIDKVLVPAVVEILDAGAYSASSSKQSRSFAAFCSQLCSVWPQGRCIARLKVRLTQYLRQYLESVAIPIIKTKCTPDMQHTQGGEPAEAVEYATRGQVFRLQKLVVNLLQYWAPFLPGSQEFLLDFLSSHFLYVMSSLQALGASDVGSAVFCLVYIALKETKWLDQPDLMLQAAPLRAAAVAYGQS